MHRWEEEEDQRTAAKSAALDKERRETEGSCSPPGGDRGELQENNLENCTSL